MVEDTDLDIFLYSLGGICFLCVPINKRGHYIPSAFFVAILLLCIITFSLIDGLGLKDAGLVAYPLFIIYASFLFGRKTSPFITFLAVCSILLVYYLARSGYLSPPEFSIEIQLIVILIILVTTGSFLWAVMNSWEKVTQHLRETYDLTLSGWAHALEYRDHETEGHSQRVIEMTLELAQHLGISGRELNHIRRGALLHDIGKMSVPDSILLKNGSLTDDEWVVMKRHPVKAKELLKDIPFLKPALDIPYYHHEKWDGSGYPEGLSKEDIPLPARIFAVVDVWDALISDRPYRQAWSEENAKAYIQEQSGRFFDPKVVEAFLEVIESED
jgi:putative nucleotidyltransferase with HDIG domain